MSAPKFLSSKNDVDQILNDDKYDAFRRYTNTATWHGIPDLFNATGKIVKIFWIIVLLSSFSMLIYQMYNVIEDFAKEPHFGTSLVATVSPNGVPMPNVTICNLVRASKRKIDDIGMNLEALSYLYGSLPQCYKTSSVTLGKNSTRLKIEFQKFAVKFGETNVDPVKVFDVIGPDCNDTIIKCWWTGMEFPCCNYAKAILTSFGKCYSITPPAGDPYQASDPPMQNIPGPGNALGLLLDPQPDDAAMTFYNDFIMEGMVALVNGEPNTFWPSDPILLDLRSNNYISLTSELISYSEPKVKIFNMPCRMQAKFVHMTGEYTISKCVMDCFMESVAQYCGCLFEMGSVGINLTNSNNLRPCRIDDQACYVLILYGDEGWEERAGAEYNECINLCVPPCRDVLFYKAFITKTTAFSNQTFSLMMQLGGISNANDLIQVEIFYPFIGYTSKITSEKLSLFDLIGNIGGQMGVWAGMSIVSWVQIGFYLGRLCCCSCLCDKIKKQQWRFNKTRP